jgi:hypothetical protein
MVCLVDKPDSLNYGSRDHSNEGQLFIPIAIKSGFVLIQGLSIVVLLLYFI